MWPFRSLFRRERNPKLIHSLVIKTSEEELDDLDKALFDACSESKALVGNYTPGSC